MVATKEKSLIFIALTLLFFNSCSIESREINYGHDGCAYCQMIIVDNRYGAQIVTDKGKIYTFDSIECMFDFSKENNTQTAIQLATSYNEPGILVQADSCIFVHSKQLPSPMGAYLTAFHQEDAKKIKEDFKQYLNWGELTQQYQNIRNNNF